MSEKPKVVIVALILIGFLLVESYFGPLQLYAGLMKENERLDEEAIFLDEEIDVEIEDDEKEEEVITDEELAEPSPEDGEQSEEYIEEDAVENQESKDAVEDQESEDSVEDQESKDAVADVDVVEEGLDVNEEVIEEAEKIEEHLDIEGNVDETRVLEEIVESGLELEEVELNPQQGLVGITILNNPELSASLKYTGEGKPVITLQYEGRRVLDLGLLTNTYIIFNVSQEIANVMKKEDMKASYVVPFLVFPISGDFQQSDINIIDNQVVINFTSLLSLDLASRYEFTLEIELDELPPSSTGKYTFISQATKQIVDLGVLSDELAYATLEMDDIPILRFEDVPEQIPFQTTTIPAQPKLIKRVNPDFAISVKDTRGTGSSWSIHAEIDKPLTLQSDASVTLDHALRFYRSSQEVIILDELPQQIYSGQTGTSDITTVEWDEGTGPLIYVSPLDVKEAGEYQTTITWTLVDAP